MATFSVIIPVYNIEKYLVRCLESIITQTFSDLEIIIVDDGSTDSSSHICDRYASVDSRVQVIHKKNGGLVSARKAGAKVATSDYVACIDGDDWIENNYFQKFSKIVRSFSPDLICCGAIIQKRDRSNEIQRINEEFGEYSKDDIEERIFPHLITFSNNIWGKVFKRSIYREIQLSVDERIKMAEDACVVIPCVYKATSIYVMEDCLYNYRYNPSSMTKNKTVYSLEEPKLIAKHMSKYVDLRKVIFRQQIYNSTVHRLFNRCTSQFYREEPYVEVCRRIDACLEDQFYKECIENSQFSLRHNPKDYIARLVLKLKWYWILNIYSKVR